MFKCKECGTEFDTKPDYCDCGNDTFEEITLQAEETPAPVTENISENKVEPQKYVEETVTKISKKERTIKPYAIIIFVLCLILSVLVILFAWNPKQTNLTENTLNETTPAQKPIPEIEKIWNNKLPAASIPKKKETETVKTETPRTITKNVKTEQKPFTQQKPQTTKVTLNKQPTITKPTVQKQTTNTPSAQPQKIAKQTVTTNPQEIANYKIKLRNHIASKIYFASVVGDGSCTFSFSVSSSGELTGKKPVSLSDNDSLNDAVYNALRQVYSYNAPPAGYKGETLKLTVKMYNNNFEVALN